MESELPKLEILLVEDSDSDAFILEMHLNEAAESPFELYRAKTRREAIRLIESERKFAVALYDLTLPDSRGLDGLEVFVGLAETVPVIVLTGTLDETVGRKALSIGAQDFLTKNDLSGKAVCKSIRFSMERFRLMQERISMQARIARAERQQAMSTLAAGLAHDIGNMLTPVVMSAELGLMIAQDDQIKELFEDVRTSARSASELARQLMSMKSAKEANELRVVGFREAVNLAISLVKRSVPPGIGFEVEIDSEELRELRVALGLTDLQQVLVNLVTNAVHALEGTDSPEIKVAVYSKAEDGKILVEVSDNGPGFDTSSLDNAFKEYYTTKKSKGGTGLGLAICSRIVRRLEGGIEASNGENGGASVQFWLPLAVEETTVDEDTYTLVSEVGIKRILIVDDNLMIGTRSKHLLELLGFEVKIASDTDALLAVTSWSDEPYDAVVLDYAMPGINGVSMARRIRETSQSLPIVFATAYADLIDEAELDRLGLATVVAKPFEARELLTAIRTAGNRESSR